MKKLDVHTRKRIAKSGAETTTRFVRCPVDGRWIPLEACRRCDDCEKFEPPADGTEGAVICSRGDEDPVLDLNVLMPIAEKTPIAEVMDERVLCVNEDVAVAAVAQRLSDEHTGVAIVVARDGHPVGIVSALDIAGAPTSLVARAAMTPFVITLLDNATVADAIPLVVERGLHHIPILSAGNVLGVVSPAAILRWVTQKLR